MTAQEAKLQVLCTCYSLHELKAKREELLSGAEPSVLRRLIDTATMSEVTAAIQAYDDERFEQQRGYVALSRMHLRLILAHLAPDHDFGKALENGFRSLCVCESKEALQKRLDGIPSAQFENYPWHVAEDATEEELACAVALYDDKLYRHLRDLAERTDLDRIASWCGSGDIAFQKELLLAGDKPRVIDVEPYWTASVELLDNALEKCDEPRYVFSRRWIFDQCVRFEQGRYYYFITDGSDVGTFVAGLIDPDTMIPLLGMICLEKTDPRQVAKFFVDEFHFGIISENEAEENVAFVQHIFSDLTDLVSDFDYGDAHEFFRVNVSDVRDYFSDKGMAAMAQSIDWKACSERLFS